jgi:hypothetical protein
MDTHMKFDQESKDLLAGARFIEQHGFPPDDPHPLRAIARTLQVKGGVGWKSPEHKSRYYNAATRLHDACGMDNSDLSPAEAIDSLVAAAYWEVP